MDKLNSRCQMMMEFALILAQMRCSQHQHGPNALAPGLYQMGGDFGNARRVFGCHARPDQGVDGCHIRAQICCKPVMGGLRFGGMCHVLCVHLLLLSCLDKLLRLAIG